MGVNFFPLPDYKSPFPAQKVGLLNFGLLPIRTLANPPRLTALGTPPRRGIVKVKARIQPQVPSWEGCPDARRGGVGLRR